MQGISTYIVDREPGKFGGQQDDYAQRVETIVLAAAEDFRVAIDANQNLQELFHKTLNNFALARSQIAIDHGTKDAEQFGERRDQVDSDRFSFLTTTTLGGVYREAHDLLKPYFKKHLNAMHQTADTTLKVQEETCFGRGNYYEFFIWNYHNYNEFYIDFTNFEEYKEICTLCHVAPRPEPLTSDHWFDLYQNKEAMQKLKQASPQEYRRHRITGAFLQTR